MLPGADIVGMGQYARGDVLLASVTLDDRTMPKARPVVVIRTEEPGRIYICPVSSKPPSDAPSLPLSIDDFATGGLDLFGESYVMTSRILRIQSSAVIGKKGRLAQESLEKISAQVPSVRVSRSAPVKQPGKPRKTG